MAQKSNIVFPPNSVSNPGYNRFETLITIQDIKRRFLFGVKFVDNDGNVIPEVVFQDAVQDAISEFEHDYNLTLTPTTYTEKRDYNLNDYRNWGYLQLNHRPVTQIKSIKLKTGNNSVLTEIPLDWVRLYTETGQVQITPTSGAYTTFNMNGSMWMPHLYGSYSSFPQLFEIEYVAGFEQDKIPRIVNSYIGLNAAIPLLLIAGDLIIGAGISSQSISLDGLSQSVNSTLSAENSGYGGRVREYRQELKETEKILAKYYKGLDFDVS